MTSALDHDWVPIDTLANRLVLVRRSLNLTQRQAAESCGLTFGEWQSMEDGREPRGLDSKVKRICSALGVNRDWLMWGGQLAAADDAEGVPAHSAALDAVREVKFARSAKPGGPVNIRCTSRILRMAYRGNRFRLHRPLLRVPLTTRTRLHAA